MFLVIKFKKYGRPQGFKRKFQDFPTVWSKTRVSLFQTCLRAVLSPEMDSLACVDIITYLGFDITPSGDGIVEFLVKSTLTKINENLMKLINFHNEIIGNQLEKQVFPIQNHEIYLFSTPNTFL